MTQERPYTVARNDGEGREFNLTLREAAQSILHHDGADYEIREEPDGGHCLWARQQVANIKWHRCAVWSHCTTKADAEDDIFYQVIQRSVAEQGWGMLANRMDTYLTGLREMLEEADDEDKPTYQAMIDEAMK